MNTLSFNVLLGDAVETTIDGIAEVLQRVTVCGAWFGRLIGPNPLHTPVKAEGDRKTFIVEGVTIHSDWLFDPKKGRKVSLFWVSPEDAQRLYKPVAKTKQAVTNGVDYSKLIAAAFTDSAPAPAL